MKIKMYIRGHLCQVDFAMCGPDRSVGIFGTWLEIDDIQVLDDERFQIEDDMDELGAIEEAVLETIFRWEKLDEPTWAYWMGTEEDELRELLESKS